jgi:hypothetical protein
VSDESLRLAHEVACARERESAVAPQYVPVALPDHEDELMVKHLSTVLPSHFSVFGEAQ